MPKKVVKRNIRAAAITPYDHKEVIFSIVNIVSELKRAFVHSSSFYKKSTLITYIYLYFTSVTFELYPKISINYSDMFVLARPKSHVCKSESSICLQTIFLQSTCRMETKWTEKNKKKNIQISLKNLNQEKNENVPVTLINIIPLSSNSTWASVRRASVLAYVWVSVKAC